MDSFNDRLQARYCPICGKERRTGCCSAETLRAIDSAGKREEYPAFLEIPDETKRLFDGLSILQDGDDEPLDYDVDREEWKKRNEY